MYKRLLGLGLAAVLLSGEANATLIDRGGGLIYDTVLDATWLQDANYAKTSGFDLDGLMNWNPAVAWAEGLIYFDSARGVTWNDWRLPSMDVNADELTVDCSSVDEASCRDNEYGYIYYQNGVSSAAQGIFENVHPGGYWSGTEDQFRTTHAGDFGFHSGGQGGGDKSGFNAVWGVRDGDVAAIPEPTTVLLMASG